MNPDLFVVGSGYLNLGLGADFERKKVELRMNYDNMIQKIEEDIDYQRKIEFWMSCFLRKNRVEIENYINLMI